MAVINCSGVGTIVWNQIDNQQGFAEFEVSTLLAILIELDGDAPFRESEISTAIQILIDQAGSPLVVYEVSTLISILIDQAGSPGVQTADPACVSALASALPIVQAKASGQTIVTGQAGGAGIVSGTVRVCGGKPMDACPVEINFDGGNELTYEDVQDDRTTPPTPLTDPGTCSVTVIDKATDLPILISPIALAQGTTPANAFAASFFASAAAGFAIDQRLRLEYRYALDSDATVAQLQIVDALVVA